VNQQKTQLANMSAQSDALATTRNSWMERVYSDPQIEQLRDDIEATEEKLAIETLEFEMWESRHEQLKAVRIGLCPPVSRQVSKDLSVSNCSTYEGQQATRAQLVRVMSVLDHIDATREEEVEERPHSRTDSRKSSRENLTRGSSRGHALTSSRGDSFKGERHELHSGSSSRKMDYLLESRRFNSLHDSSRMNNLKNESWSQELFRVKSPDTFRASFRTDSNKLKPNTSEKSGSRMPAYRYKAGRTEMEMVECASPERTDMDFDELDYCSKSGKGMSAKTITDVMNADPSLTRALRPIAGLEGTLLKTVGENIMAWMVNELLDIWWSTETERQTQLRGLNGKIFSSIRSQSSEEETPAVVDLCAEEEKLSDEPFSSFEPVNQTNNESEAQPTPSYTTVQDVNTINRLMLSESYDSFDSDDESIGNSEKRDVTSNEEIEMKEINEASSCDFIDAADTEHAQGEGVPTKSSSPMTNNGTDASKTHRRTDIDAGPRGWLKPIKSLSTAPMIEEKPISSYQMKLSRADAARSSFPTPPIIESLFKGELPNKKAASITSPVPLKPIITSTNVGHKKLLHKNTDALGCNTRTMKNKDDLFGMKRSRKLSATPQI